MYDVGVTRRSTVHPPPVQLHVYPSTSSTHVASFMHGLDSHSSMFVSQTSPVNPKNTNSRHTCNTVIQIFQHKHQACLYTPASQSHSNVSCDVRLEQLPPFSHVTFSQKSMTDSQRSPVYPGKHEQLNCTCNTRRMRSDHRKVTGCRGDTKQLTTSSYPVATSVQVALLLQGEYSQVSSNCGRRKSMQSTYTSTWKLLKHNNRKSDVSG